MAEQRNPNRQPGAGYGILPAMAPHLELAQAHQIAALFDLPGPLEIHDFPEKGNINQHTFLVLSGAGKTQHLLQRLNPLVFTQPRAVMKGMIACIRAQQDAKRAGVIGNVEWEIIELIPTRDGQQYIDIDGGEYCWRMMVRIPGARSYRNLKQISGERLRRQVAREAGRGLALFGNLTSRMDISTVGIPLPGYRDTELYYNQLSAVLAECRTPDEAVLYLPGDPLVRKSTERHFLIHISPEEYRLRQHDSEVRSLIDLALRYRPFGLTLAEKLKSGELKKVVVHGDTKLDNFLFSSQTGNVKALVDLDTIMPHTWLSDWGDMVRSLVNIAGERETELDRIEVDLHILEELANGFLESTGNTSTAELELMVEAPQIMALELAVRFLADYLRGDSYFSLAPGEPDDLNKIRAQVQFRLFERMQACTDFFRNIVAAHI